MLPAQVMNYLFKIESISTKSMIVLLFIEDSKISWSFEYCFISLLKNIQNLHQRWELFENSSYPFLGVGVSNENVQKENGKFNLLQVILFVEKSINDDVGLIKFDGHWHLVD